MRTVLQCTVVTHVLIDLVNSVFYYNIVFNPIRFVNGQRSCRKLLFMNTLPPRDIC